MIYIEKIKINVKEKVKNINNILIESNIKKGIKIKIVDIKKEIDCVTI
jgi:hypothetical protein